MEIERIKQINIKAYGILFELENLLRALILTKLQDYKNDWWSEIKTKKFVVKIDKSYGSNLINDIDREIKHDSEYLGSDQLLIHKIYYTDMQNLYDIISYFWEDYFKSIFIGKRSNDQFRPNFNYVRYLRNKVMHSKPVTEQEYKNIKSFYNEVKEYVKKDGLELKEFHKCIYLSEMLGEIRLEITEHSNALGKGEISIDTLKIDVYESYNVEWWWSAHQDEIFNIIDSFYEHIKNLRKKLENPRNTKYAIKNTIQKEKIVAKCDEIISKLNEKIN